MQTTLGDLIAGMGSKSLVAVVKRGQSEPRLKATRNPTRAALKNYWAVRSIERALRNFRHAHFKSTPTSANCVDNAQSSPPYPAEEERTPNDGHAQAQAQAPTPPALHAETEPPRVVGTHKNRKRIRKINFITDHFYSTDDGYYSADDDAQRVTPQTRQKVIAQLSFCSIVVL